MSPPTPCTPEACLAVSVIENGRTKAGELQPQGWEQEVLAGRGGQGKPGVWVGLERGIEGRCFAERSLSGPHSSPRPAHPQPQFSHLSIWALPLPRGTMGGELGEDPG